MLSICKYLFIFSLIALSGNLCAQVDSTFENSRSSKKWKRDSIEKTRTYNPTKALLLSAALPGSGQIYNRSYWKLPIVYGSSAAFVYFIHTNNKNYKTFRNAYRAETDNLESTVNPYEFLSSFDLLRLRDKYQKRLEMSYIGASVFYLVNIGDAFVDAHLKGFDIGEDLTMKVHPVWMEVDNNSTVGLKLSLTIK